MKMLSPTAPAPTVASLCCAAAAGFGTVLATQGWLIRRARQRLATRRQGVLPVPAPFDRTHRPTRLLVVGDSTGVGLGSGTAAQSLQGRLLRDFDGAEVVNRSQVGARVADVAGQLAPLHRAGERFDFALVVVGGNDILRMTPLGRLFDDARTMLGALRPVACKAVWMGSADVGIAPCFIPPFSWALSHRSRQATRRLGDAAREAGVGFIDFVDHPLSADFRRRRARYFAADGVHPSGFAYGRCYEVLKAHPGFPALAAGRSDAA